MIINTNTGSANAARILAESTSALQKSLKRLSTGSRIASIEDDAAGSAMGAKFSAQVSRLNASRSNVGNMISFSQTQDGYMEKVAGALERMSELAMLATDETKSNNDRDLYQKEYEELQDYIANVGDKTFNGTSLFSSDTLSVAVGNSLNGSAVKIGLTGANLKSDADYINVYSTSTAAVTGNVITEIGTASLAAYTLGKVQSAISQLGYDRAQVGANISRLETERNTISILRDNLSAAKSRILDVDVAEESANFARQQILVQSGTAMLAQANVLPQAALALIG
jgi:flagellin